MSIARAHSYLFPLFSPLCDASFVWVGSRGIDQPSDLWKGVWGSFICLPSSLYPCSASLAPIALCVSVFPAHSARSSSSCLCTSFTPKPLSLLLFFLQPWVKAPFLRSGPSYCRSGSLSGEPFHRVQASHHPSNTEQPCLLPLPNMGMLATCML